MKKACLVACIIVLLNSLIMPFTLHNTASASSILYYYDQYVPEEYWRETANWGNPLGISESQAGGHTILRFDSITNTYTVDGTYREKPDYLNPNLYEVNGDYIYRKEVRVDYSPDEGRYIETYLRSAKYRWDNTSDLKKGVLLESDLVLDDSYPENGMHSDGYWYVRKGRTDADESLLSPGEYITAISAGGNHSLALTSEGRVLAWGGNYTGQLGDGSNTSRTTPVEVSDLSNIIEISAGIDHSLALDADGNVWAWGSNEHGALGDGTTQHRHLPIQVSGLSSIADISAGFQHSKAVKNDGTVWAWGRGSYFSGGGTAIDPTIPRQMGSMWTVDGDVLSIDAGNNHTLLLTSIKRVYAQGDNHSFQLGNRSNDNSYRATYINTTMVNAREISAGGSHSLAVTEEGEVYAWGGNQYGALGDGTITNRNEPAKVNGIANVTTVSGGGAYSLALTSMGTVYSWGWNESGQLGDGTFDMRTTPVQIEGLSDVIAISAGNTHSLALKSDGSVYGWGNNRSGQLGNGSQQVSTPIQIIPPNNTSKAPLDKINENPGETTIEDLIDIGIEDIVDEHLDEYREALEEYKEDIGRDLTPEDIQNVIDAINAVIEAERNPTTENIDRAQEVIDRLEDGNLKDRLQERLDYVRASLIPSRPNVSREVRYENNTFVVEFSWDEVEHTNEYLIYRDNQLIATIPGGLNNYDYQDLLAETGRYLYEIYASSSYGRSAPYEIQLEVDHPDLSVPQQLEGTVTATEVTLTWKAVEHADSYAIYRNDSLIVNTEETTFTDSGLTPNTTYNYGVVAKNEGKQSAPATIQVTTDQLALSKPVVSFSTEENQVHLIWNPISSADGYRVLRNGEMIADVINHRMYTDSDVVANFTYQYVVVAYNSWTEVQSDPVNVTLAPVNTEIDAYALVQRSAIENTYDIALRFTVPAFAQKVQVERNPKWHIISRGDRVTYDVYQSGKYQYTASTDDNHGYIVIQDRGIEANQVLKYTIAPFDFDGNGGYTKTVLTSTLPAELVHQYEQDLNRKLAEQDLYSLRDALNAVIELEETSKTESLHKAKEMIVRLVDGVVKEELFQRINLYLDAKEALEKAKQTKKAADIHHARDQIERLPQGQIKDHLWQALQPLLDLLNQRDGTGGEGNSPPDSSPRLEHPKKNLYFIYVEDEVTIIDIQVEFIEGNEAKIRIPDEITNPTIRIPQNLYAQLLEFDRRITIDYKGVVFDIALDSGKLDRSSKEVTVSIAMGHRSDASVTVTVDPGVTIFFRQSVYRFNPSTQKWEQSDGKISFETRSDVMVTFSLVTKSFADIQDHWAKEEIEYLATAQIVNGRSAETFGPDSLVTRAEFVAMLARALDLKDHRQINFLDVSADQWFATEVKAAASHGYIRGFPDGTFQPDHFITREEMLSIITRVHEAQGKPIEINSVLHQKLRSFSDFSQISAWAIEYMGKALQIGLTEGVSTSELAPKSNATRAQAAVLIYRLLEQD